MKIIIMGKSRRVPRGNRFVTIAASLAIGMIAGLGLVSAAEAPPAAKADGANLPAEKQTTLGLYLTAREAFEKWQAAPAKVMILDVRTPDEYLFVGHAAMAWNIPFMAQSYQWDTDKKQLPMKPLPDFVTRVGKVAKPEDTLYVMCRSGGRGAEAVNALAAAGFKHVFNITDGMEGDAVKDPDSVFHGQRLVNGWKNSGLPWTYKIDPALMVLPAQ